jgi:Spy/CpxP family protein refolding chaperone
MKTKARIINQIIIVLIFNMIMMTTSAQESQPGQGGNKNIREQVTPPSPFAPVAIPSPPSHPFPPPPPGREGMEEALAPFDLPDLTPDQQTRIKKADLKHMSELTPLENQIREKSARLSTILITIPVDQKQADQVADEIGKTAASILKARISHDQELRSILTPDQQVVFDSRPKPWLNHQQ